jgi:hypothetical protein
VIVYFAALLALVAFLLGYLSGSAGRAEQQAASYRGGKAMQRARDIARLRYLRHQLEEDDDGLRTEAAYLLADVCEALCLSDGEAQHVMGGSYFLLESPVSEVACAGDLDEQALAVCPRCARLVSAAEILAVGGCCESCWYTGYERDGEESEEVW